MGSFFRSEELDLYCLLIHRENAYNLISQLGDKDLFHFIDADPNALQFNRLFYNQTKRCDELLKNISELGEIMNLYGFDNGLGKGNVQNFLNLLEMKRKSLKQDGQHYIDEVEQDIQTTLKDIRKQISAAQEIRNNINLTIEEKACLENIVPNFGQQDISNLQSGKQDDSSKIGKIIGTIKMVDSLRFQKFMFRATKGKCFMIVNPIETQGTKYKIVDPNSPTEEIQKGYFLFIYNSSTILENKLMKICRSVEANIFQFDSDIENHQDNIKLNEETFLKNKELLRLTHKHLEEQFNALQKQTDEITQLEQYRLTILREKQIYHHINLTKNTGAVLKAYVWLPKKEEENIIKYLQESQDPRFGAAQLHQVSENDYDKYLHEQRIPTKIQQNEFLNVFQEIVNTYGVPRYREINPALFTIVTFPFLFGVMFGDIGHGTLLLIFGLYLIFSYDQKIDCNNTLYRCRFIIAMMGFFATYCGFIYNDFMSIPLNLFGSCYTKKSQSFRQREDSDCVYPFGIDPAWLDSQNSLTFYNSFKMKTSIIFGISQMTLGIILKGLNSLFNVSAVDFFFEFIPQIIFLLCTFGYMVLLIILKWLTTYDDPRDAPSILNIMLNFPLRLGQLDPKYDPILGYIDVSRRAQENLQFSLLMIALVCIPLMLLPKPLIIYFQSKKEKEVQSHDLVDISQFGQTENEQLIQKEKTSSQSKQIEQTSVHHHSDFSEIFVHQIIESIEFVLGSISHTASYLRLWALSLAHSQLAEVFFEKTLLSSIESSSIIGIIVGFFIFAIITFGVLMCMDVMECFLHTLRLHWVEFQSKFYKADGLLFSPLSFRVSLEKEKAEFEN